MSRLKEPLVVTTSGKLARREEIEDAKATATRLAVPYVSFRRSVPVKSLLDGTHAVLMLRGDGVVLLDEHGSFRWTTGMAHVRARRLDDGIDQPDGVLVAGDIRPGDHVLDCTLGLAQDAWVMARAVGPAGRVVGVEKQLALYAVTSEGLRRQSVPEGFCAIECVHADALTYLREQAAHSFDCVMLDPMFSKPGKSQPAFDVLRRHADHTPVSPELLDAARRVARRWVVVKAAPSSNDLNRLGLRVEPFRRSADLRFARAAPL